MSSDRAEFPVITLHHAALDLLLRGPKSWEIRPVSYRRKHDPELRWFGLHAAVKLDRFVYPDIEPGHIVAVAVVTGQVRVTPNNFEIYQEQHRVRRWGYPKRDHAWAWQLSGIRILRHPIEMAGNQGIWYAFETEVHQEDRDLGALGGFA